ncbi:hypothetical protein BDDG_07816 [Blastomyces dermatitidis ATCC 18188]|uniref:Uncharacterized protein n=1 Tax=Ajellomyces dermatitidis (strain ATCC 18188 / CBS 674.68) TaxID=653446 RepID=F2TNQ8_AJEDA|nr:hypothetical protein BDDG_07816 [Blastomyces dermatitidis ATCC 18188]
MTLSERLMLSCRSWKIYDINLAATCDDIQQVLFCLRSLANVWRGGAGGGGGGGGGGGTVDGQTVDVIDDNVYHCQRAVYDFETRVLSVRAGVGEEDLGFPVSIRWCPFDRVAHGALKCVIDELQLVISVAVDVFLLVGGGRSDDHGDCDEWYECDGAGCQLPLWEPVNRRNCSTGWASVDWSMEKQDEISLLRPPPRKPLFSSPSTTTAYNSQQKQQPNRKWALVTDIDGWLGKVTNKEVDWDYWHAIIDEYYYPADHHHHLSLPIPIPGCVSNSGDDDSDGAGAGDGGSASTAASDGEWPSTSIIREYLDSPPRDASFQKRCIETGDRRDDWCFDDIGELSGGLG